MAIALEGDVIQTKMRACVNVRRIGHEIDREQSEKVGRNFMGWNEMRDTGNINDESSFSEKKRLNGREEGTSEHRESTVDGASTFVLGFCFSKEEGGALESPTSFFFGLERR